MSVLMKSKRQILRKLNPESHTLGGAGRCYTAVIHTEIPQSGGRRQNMPGWVAITDAPVYMRGRCFLNR